MKGLFFKSTTGIECEILSDALCVRHEMGYDDVMVVVKKLDDNCVHLIPVDSIDKIESPKNKKE